MKYRNEIKHEISLQDAEILRKRLNAVMKRDKYSVNGKYFIRSLYFDNCFDKALNEKIDGVNYREKFRMRYYNLDPSLIHLEKKSKINGLCLKESTEISQELADEIIHGSYEALATVDDRLLREFYFKLKTQCLRPKTIVDYTREPFVYAPGNVRVTLDSNIRTGLNQTDFLNPDCVTLPTGNSVILEVKWDEYLPDTIKRAVALPSCSAGAFSKYAVCRQYG